MKLISCEFNMDSGCVEMRFDDGTALDIDCMVVESEYAHTMRQKTELDWLVYNDAGGKWRNPGISPYSFQVKSVYPALHGF